MVTLRHLRRLGLLGCLVCSVAVAQDGAAHEGETAPGRPDGREASERLKAERDRAVQMNELITRAQTAMNEKKWAEAAEILRQMTATEPGRWEYHRSLGDALLNLGKYEDAIRSYETGIPLVQKEPTTAAPGGTAADLKLGAARMLVSEGNAFLKLGKPAEAISAYGKAAQSDPNPGTAYFNIAATCYNLGRTEEALEYCNKTIAIDPARADAYFIKGSVLMGNATLDKGGRLIGPPGMRESLQKYLELMPDGPHAADVKEMLKFTDDNSAGKKK